MLVHIRMYAEGANLEEAGESGNTASDTAAYVSLYRKTVPHEQFKFDDDPAGLALRFEVLTSDPNLTLDQLRAICSRNGQRMLATKDALDWFVKRARGTLSQKSVTTISLTSVWISLTRAQPKVQGNDATGYRVTLWPSAKYKEERYIVKEDGHYKLLGLSRSYGGVGLEILDRIALGDLSGARILLDWVREEWHIGRWR